MGLQRGDKGLQRVIGGDNGLQGVTGGDKGLQGVTGGDKGLQGVTRGYSNCKHCRGNHVVLLTMR